MNKGKVLAQKPKSIKAYIFLIVAPFILLFLVAFLQIIVQFTFNKVSAQTDDICISTVEGGDPCCYALTSVDSSCTESNSVAETVIKVIQLLLGTTAVVMLFLEPLWIILLIKAVNYNNNLKSAQAP